MKKCMVILWAIFLVEVVGCGSEWHYDYDIAVRQARNRECDLLVFYKDPLDVRSSRMQDNLASSAVRPMVKSMVRCMLIPSYRPNRAFVAQYDVQQPPALIVVHSDGTYHALRGEQSVEEIQSFLASAEPPGLVPNRNPRIPQSNSLNYFNVYELAAEKARRQNRRLVIIYKWWLNAESNELIRRVSQPSVSRYFADSVNCILDWDYLPNREVVARFGVDSFPAIIVVEPDGRHRSLLGLPSVERIIGLMVSHSDVGDGTSHVDKVPEVVWFGDINAARLVAQRTGRDLFVFFHSLRSPASESAARLLKLPVLQQVLSGLVNCRLNWADRKTRELAAEYGINAPPSCLVIRADGTHDATVDHVTVAAIRRMLNVPGP